MTPRTSIARLADDAPVPHPESWPARRPPSVAYEANDPTLCSDCPPIGYPTDKTRCTPCPRRAPSVAYDAVVADLRAQAPRTVRAAIKASARAYALRPRELDAIATGLFNTAPGKLVVLLATIKRYSTNRNFGFGGEIPAINLRGAMIHARWSRAIASRNARRTG